jgi:hypothetical protein
MKQAESKMEGSKMGSSLFYAEEISPKEARSPKVSVLEIEEKEWSEEEELRDVIDQDFINSYSLSKTASPFISINQSSKNLDDRKDKRVPPQPTSHDR